MGNWLPMTQVTVAQAILMAIEHHRAGRLREAESIYRQVLAAEPNHPDALHFLGVLAHQAGQFQTAAELIEHAIAAHPGVRSITSTWRRRMGFT